MSSDTFLANTVSAYALILAGILCLLFCYLLGPQPRRWVIAYLGVFITGVPTVWYHGFGETYLAGIFDGGTNLLLVWLMQVAALWDGYSTRVRWGVAVGSGIINLSAIMTKLLVGPGFNKIFPVDLGDFGGFNISELVLIAGSLLAIGLLYGQINRLTRQSKNLLYFSTGLFFAGAIMASAGNHTVHLTILAYHATWHVIGAFGFICLWGFNHSRFNLRQGSTG